MICSLLQSFDTAGSPLLRAIGVEKTRLSRRIATLEKELEFAYCSERRELLR
jgi:hypothetical protein